jgi:hypothetical protein
MTESKRPHVDTSASIKDQWDHTEFKIRCRRVGTCYLLMDVQRDRSSLPLLAHCMLQVTSTQGPGFRTETTRVANFNVVAAIVAFHTNDLELCARRLAEVHVPLLPEGYRQPYLAVLWSCLPCGDAWTDGDFESFLEEHPTERQWERRNELLKYLSDSGHLTKLWELGKLGIKEHSDVMTLSLLGLCARQDKDQLATIDKLVTKHVLAKRKALPERNQHYSSSADIPPGGV